MAVNRFFTLRQNLHNVNNKDLRTKTDCCLKVRPSQLDTGV